MTYEQEAARGNVVGALRQGILTGTLWAVAISWSTAIRAITLALLPTDTGEQIFGELLATLVITALGVGTAVLAGRCLPAPKPPSVPPPPRRLPPIPLRRRQA